MDDMQQFEIRQDFLWRMAEPPHQVFHIYTGETVTDPWADVDLRDWPGCLAFSLHGAALWQRIMERPPYIGDRFGQNYGSWEAPEDKR